MSQDSRKNLEFNLTFCETNLRYLHGEPPSEERDQKIAFNISEVARLKNRLVAPRPKEENK